MGARRSGVPEDMTVREMLTEQPDVAAALEECVDDIWEAVAGLTRDSPEIIAAGLFTNLEGLLDALLTEGHCSPDDLRRMAARLTELAGSG